MDAHLCLFGAYLKQICDLELQNASYLTEAQVDLRYELFSMYLIDCYELLWLWPSVTTPQDHTHGFVSHQGARKRSASAI